MNGVVPSFLTELYQLFFSYLRLEDLKSAVMVSERWQDTGEVLKLWEDKKVANQDDDSMSLSSGMHKVKRGGFCSIQAISLKNDQEATLAQEMREDCELEELDIGNGSGTPGPGDLICGSP